MGIMETLGHMMMDNHELHFAPSPCNDPARRWLITLSAPLSAFNGDWMDEVETGKESDSFRGSVKDTWGVSDRFSFERQARWLTEEGQRTGYEMVWRAIQAIDAVKQGTPPVMRAVLSMVFPAYYYVKASRQIDYQKIADTAGKSTEDVGKAIGAAGDLLDDLKDDLSVPPAEITSLIAWDAVRLVSLTRWAVQLGYIEDDEFEKYAGGLAQQAREAYPSWNHLSAAYVAAGHIWNPSETRRENLVRTTRMLLKSAKSPYRQVAWRP